MAGPKNAANSGGTETATEGNEKGDNQALCVKAESGQVPPPVWKKGRLVKAMKKLQYDATLLEAEFYREVHKLECKYGTLCAPLNEKRRLFANGLAEPTDEECTFPSDSYDDLEIDASENGLLTNPADGSGVDGFWLTAMKNVDMIADMIQNGDEPILLKLQDIKVILSESDPMGFQLEFHFAPNEYFTNSVLTKEYEMKCKVDDSDPFSFDGPEIYKCSGCKIDWKPGKDVTVKTVTKKQKHKNSGSVRLVKKQVVADSFFNFFSPPIIKEDPESDAEDSITRDILAADFEIGHFIRERFVPRAVLFYTGEALDIESLVCETGEEEEVEEEEEEEEDEDDVQDKSL